MDFIVNLLKPECRRKNVFCCHFLFIACHLAMRISLIWFDVIFSSVAFSPKFVHFCLTFSFYRKYCPHLMWNPHTHTHQQIPSYNFFGALWNPLDFFDYDLVGFNSLLLFISTHLWSLPLFYYFLYFFVIALINLPDLFFLCCSYFD